MSSHRRRCPRPVTHSRTWLLRPGPIHRFASNTSCAVTLERHRTDVKDGFSPISVATRKVLLRPFPFVSTRKALHQPKDCVRFERSTSLGGPDASIEVC